MSHRQTESKKGQRGATLVEGALLMALIAVVAVPALTQTGTKAADKFCQGVGAFDSNDRFRDFLYIPGQGCGEGF